MIVKFQLSIEGSQELEKNFDDFIADPQRHDALIGACYWSVCAALKYPQGLSVKSFLANKCADDPDPALQTVSPSEIVQIEKKD